MASTSPLPRATWRHAPDRAPRRVGRALSQYEERRRAQYQKRPRTRSSRGLRAPRRRSGQGGGVRDERGLGDSARPLGSDRARASRGRGRRAAPRGARKSRPRRAAPWTRDHAAARLDVRRLDARCPRPGRPRGSRGPPRPRSPRGRAGSAYADSLTELADGSTSRAREASRSAARADSLPSSGARSRIRRGGRARASPRPESRRRRATVWSPGARSEERQRGGSRAEARRAHGRARGVAGLQRGALRGCADGGPEGARARPGSKEARAWKSGSSAVSPRRAPSSTRIKQLYIRGMEAFSSGDYKEALGTGSRSWCSIL
jgi:hypothetical protein